MADQPLHEWLRYYARKTPEKPAIIWYGRKISYAELDQRSDACAGFLASLGVGKGDPVALFMQNSPQYVIAHFGIQKLGAIVGPCSPLFKEKELNYQLQDMGARVVLAARDLYPVLDAARQDTAVEHMALINYCDFLPESPSYTVPDEVMADRQALDSTFDFMEEINKTWTMPPEPALSMDDVAMLVYTSGTTGRPKGAMLPYRSALFKARGGAERVGLDTDDIHLVIPPLYHISGMLCGINIPVYLGGTAVLHYRFNAKSTLESIEHHQPTYWKGLAPMLVALLDESSSDRFDVSSLRLCAMTSFGIPTTLELAERWRAGFSCDTRVFEAGYGLTETHTFDSAMSPDAIKWGTNGTLLPGVQCRIIDRVTGRDVQPGAEGEILLKSEGNFQGYWKDEIKTDKTLRDGWVYTGDVGKVDEAGYLTLLGRIKELIKVSGYSVFPDDVEALLLEHPGVIQAGVVGVSDPHKGEVVKAVIVLRPEAKQMTSDELIAWSRQNMSAYKVPRIIEFRTSLPMTASGKVVRRLL